MTDQLEHDLRAMLADRAGAVTADPSAGELAIADRLRRGDQALADVALLAPRTARPRRVAAAAAAAVLVAGVAAVIARDDDKVTLITPSDTVEPVIFTAPGTAEDVALAYLEDRLDVAGTAIDLRSSESIGATDAAGYQWTRTDVDQPSGGFVGLLLRDQSWAVLEAFSDGPSIDTAERDRDSVTIRTTGPPSSHVQLGVHRLSGETLTSGGCGGEAVGPGGAIASTEPVECSLVDEPIDVGNDPLTVRFSVVTQEGVRLSLEERLLLVSDEPAATTTLPEVADSPTIGAPGATAKDVAEQFTRLVYGVEYITANVEQFDGLHEVTLEGEGNTLIATVVFDEEHSREQLIELRQPDTSFVPRFENGLNVAAPNGGNLVVTVYGGNPGVDVSTAAVVVDTRIDGPGTDHGPFDITGLSFAPFWIRMDLVTDEGQVLRYFSTMGG